MNIYETYIWIILTNMYSTQYFVSSKETVSINILISVLALYIFKSNLLNLT